MRRIRVPQNKKRVLKPGEKLIFTDQEVQEILDDPVRLEKHMNFKYRVVKTPKYTPHAGVVIEGQFYLEDKLDYFIKTRLETGKVIYTLWRMWLILLENYNLSKRLSKFQTTWVLGKTFYYNRHDQLFRKIAGEQVYAEMKSLFLWNTVQDLLTETVQENLFLTGADPKPFIFDNILDYYGLSCQNFLRRFFPESDYQHIEDTALDVLNKRVLADHLSLAKDEPFLDVPINESRFVLYPSIPQALRDQFYILPRPTKPKPSLPPGDKYVIDHDRRGVVLSVLRRVVHKPRKYKDVEVVEELPTAPIPRKLDEYEDD
jgi:hypothetical protein